jgi:hypothetical protein
MKRKECKKQIIDLMIQIRDVYRKYNANGKYLSLTIIGDTLIANNMYNTEDADHPLDIYYDIKQIMEKDRHKLDEESYSEEERVLNTIAYYINYYDTLENECKNNTEYTLKDLVDDIRNLIYQ